MEEEERGKGWGKQGIVARVEGFHRVSSKRSCAKPAEVVVSRNPPRRLSLVDFENQLRDETNQREQSGPRADHSSARRDERAWRVILLGARAGCLCSVETPKMRLDPERPVER